MSFEKDNNSISFNLDDELDEEEEEYGDIVEIRLLSTTIRISFIRLYKYSPLFREKYLAKESRSDLSQKIIQYLNQFNISETNAILFFKLIQNENINITNDNYRDLYKLSDYFQVKKLKKFLNKYSKSYLSDINMIIFQILEKNSVNNEQNSFVDSFNNEMEQKLSSRINECLQNKFFEKLQISMIDRILSKSDKNILSSDLLLDFITKDIEERHPLFCYLRLINLSDDKFNILYEKFMDNEDTKYFLQYLNIDLEYIRKMKDENKILLSKMNEIEQEMEKEKIEPICSTMKKSTSNRNNES